MGLATFDPLLGQMRTTDQAQFDQRYARNQASTLNLYVDKTNGTDAAGQGLASGSGATKTIQYAFDLIPPVLSANVTVNISGDTYTEQPILPDKLYPNNNTITIQGTKTTIETLTVGSGSQQGAYTNNTSHQYATVVRSSGTWTANQRANKWVRIQSSGESHLIDRNTTTTLTVTNKWVTTPVNGDTMIIEEPLTSISDIRIGNNSKNVVINDIIYNITAGISAPTLLGKYVDVTMNRCSIPPASATSLWTNKDNQVQFNDCYFTFIRLFSRNGSKVIVNACKMFRPGGANRCIHYDEGATVYLAGGTVLDGNNDASSTAIFGGGIGLMNFTGTTPTESALNQMNTIRKFVTGVNINTLSVAVNPGVQNVLWGDDIETQTTATNSSVTANKLVATADNFTTLGVGIGDKVQNITDNTWALVTAVDSATQLSLDEDIFKATSRRYRIVSAATLNTTDWTQSLDSSSTVKIMSNIKQAATAGLQIDSSTITKGNTRIGLAVSAPSGGGTANYALQLSDTGGTAAGGATFGTDVQLYRSAADILATDDDFAIKTAGKGLQVKEGTNAKMGTSTLVAGTVTVSTTAVTANSRIFLTTQSLGTVAAPKAMAVTAVTAGTSFVITSADNTDTSVVAWMIVEPA